MEKLYIGRYGVLIALVVVMNAAVVWGQPNDAATSEASLHAEMTAALKDMPTGRSRLVRSEYRYQEDINGQRLSINGVMVAEDMRCRQCRGKCKTEDLRCRSQCMGEGACLTHCEERLSKCETMCKQIFQCE